MSDPSACCLGDCFYQNKLVEKKTIIEDGKITTVKRTIRKTGIPNQNSRVKNNDEKVEEGLEMYFTAEVPTPPKEQKSTNANSSSYKTAKTEAETLQLNTHNLTKEELSVAELVVNDEIQSPPKKKRRRACKIILAVTLVAAVVVGVLMATEAAVSTSSGKSFFIWNGDDATNENVKEVILDNESYEEEEEIDCITVVPLITPTFSPSRISSAEKFVEISSDDSIDETDTITPTPIPSLKNLEGLASQNPAFGSNFGEEHDLDEFGQDNKVDEIDDQEDASRQSVTVANSPATEIAADAAVAESKAGKARELYRRRLRHGIDLKEEKKSRKLKCKEISAEPTENAGVAESLGKSNKLPKSAKIPKGTTVGDRPEVNAESGVVVYYTKSGKAVFAAGDGANEETETREESATKPTESVAKTTVAAKPESLATAMSYNTYHESSMSMMLGEVDNLIEWEDDEDNWDAVKGQETNLDEESSYVASLSKATKANKTATKAPKGTATKAPKGTKSPKGTKAPKGTKSPKGTTAPKGTKAPKATKAPKGVTPPAIAALKGTKAPKGTKSPKGTKAPKGTKSPKGTKAPKGTKSPKGTKAHKGTKSPKGTKAPKGSKAPKGTKAPKAAPPPAIEATTTDSIAMDASEPMSYDYYDVSTDSETVTYYTKSGKIAQSKSAKQSVIVVNDETEERQETPTRPTAKPKLEEESEVATAFVEELEEDELMVENDDETTDWPTFYMTNSPISTNGTTSNITSPTTPSPVTAQPTGIPTPVPTNAQPSGTSTSSPTATPSYPVMLKDKKEEITSIENENESIEGDVIIESAEESEAVRDVGSVECIGFWNDCDASLSENCCELHFADGVFKALQGICNPGWKVCVPLDDEEVESQRSELECVGFWSECDSALSEECCELQYSDGVYRALQGQCHKGWNRCVPSSDNEIV